MARTFRTIDITLETELVPEVVLEYDVEHG